MSKRLLLFVHGYNSSAKTWNELIKNLKGYEELKDYQFECFEYETGLIRLPLGTLMPQITTLAEGLSTYISVIQDKFSEIILVSHSMGGLISRKYLIENEKIGAPKIVSKLLLLATPNNGAEIANIANLLSFDHEQAKDLSPGSRFIEQLNNDWSNMKIESFVDTFFVAAAKDKIVDEKSAKGSWGTKNTRVLINYGHLDITKYNAENDLNVNVIIDLIVKEHIIRSSVPKAEKLVETVKEKLREMDSLINDDTGGIYSSRLEKTLSYESDKILTSLMEMGLPFSVGLDVIETVKDTILVLKSNEKNSLTTNDIRKITYSSIYNLQPIGYKNSAAVSWANQYAQKYGDPNRRITVLKKNRSKKIDLDYSYIENRIIPKSIESITKTAWEKMPPNMIRGSHKKHMSRVYLNAIKRIPIYVYEEATLITIFKNIATQIPHPWIASTCFDVDLVAYDLKKASKWHTDLKEYISNCEMEQCHHAIIELLHHLCSAVLGFYGSYIGCTNFGAIDQFTFQCQMIIHQTNLIPWFYSRTNELFNDLKTCRINPTEIVQLAGIISKDAKQFSDLSKDSLKKTQTDIDLFFEQIIKLLEYKILRVYQSPLIINSD